MKGEFVRGDGLVIPNNVTRHGAESFLDGLFNGVAPSIYMALGIGGFTTAMTMTSVSEPTIGVGGYGRVDLAPSNVNNWQSAVQTDDGAYVESKAVVFTPTADYDGPIERMFLVDHATNLDANVLTISAAMASQLTLTPSTDALLRTFSYRLYL